MSLPAYARAVASGIELRVKVVPGARRDEVVGLLGERLKVRTAAPPEDGKANKAVAGLLASYFRVDVREVRLLAGQSSAEKTFLLLAAANVEKSV
jgi:uncharacterized protein (TIGR00251 family)